MKPIDREHELFDVLEPPAGGTLALRRRIVAERRRRTRRRRVAAGAATAAVVVAAAFAAFGLRPALQHPPAAALDFSLARMRLGTQAVPDSSVTVAAAVRGDTAALELPSRDERVVLYLVASRTPAKPDMPRDGAEPEP